jgi:triphosphatase
VETEVELKLAARPEDLPHILSDPALQPFLRHPPVLARLTSIYYDTPDQALRTRGMALRLRRANDEWVQTLKTKGHEVNGIFTREELETPSDGQALDFSVVRDPELRAFLESEPVRRRLKPRFITDFERVAQLLHCSDNSVIELAIDHGEVRAGDKVDTISEIELELKSGNPARLNEIAALLQSRLELQPESLSKAERGYRLLPQVHGGA